MLATKNIYIQNAYKTLQVISQDEEKRLEYEAREKAIRDYNQGILETEERGWIAGEKTGIKKAGKRENRKKQIRIAKNMLAKNFDLSLIAEISGLSIAQIENLSRN